MDMTFAEKRTVPARALAVMLAFVLAFGGAIGMAFADGASPRATPVNEGNPFENGDLVWNGNVQTYRMAGVVLHVDGLTDLGAAPAPFDYPDCLTEANALFVAGTGGGNWPGWGVSDYDYVGLKVDKNIRGLKFSALPAKGHCAQSNNQTTYFGGRKGYLNLIPGLSGWSADKTVYHGVFMMAIDNGHEYDVWDQATLGCAYVYADWEVTGGITVQKAVADDDLDAFKALHGDDWKSRLKTTFQLQADDGEGGWKATSKGTAKSGEGSHIKNDETGSYTSRWNTNAKGKLTIEGLPAGRYRLVEYTAPDGCELPRDADGARSATKVCTVKAGETYTAYYKDAGKAKWYNRVAQGEIDLKKRSAAPNITDGNACYSLEGAEYTVYTDAACTESTGQVLVTDASGDAGPVTVPAGTYWVRETKPPLGYGVDAEVHGPYKVRAGATEHVGGAAGVADTPGSDPAQMWVSKLDAATGNAAPQGGASLAGAQFTVRYYDGQYATAAAAEASGAPTRTWVVETDDDGYAKLDSRYKISGDDLYYEKDGLVTIPLGTILIQETKAPAGYKLPEPNEVHVRSITMTGNAIDPVTSLNPPVVPEEVIRGDMALAKFRAATSERLSGIPFRLTDLATGESHILVTDGNGEVRTESGWNAHSMRTNASDAALRADGTIDESRLDAGAGVWFCGAADASQGARVDDGSGALPYGRYRLEELKVSKNAAYTMVSIDFEITRDGYVFEVQVPNDSAKSPWISTTARDGLTDGKDAPVSDHAAVIDRVAYANLEAGAEYTLKAALMDAGSCEPLLGPDGAPIEAGRTFTASAEQGSVEVYIPYDATAYPDARVVVFEELWRGAAKIAEHKDIEDFDQTVKNMRPELRTTARDGADGDKEIACEPGARVIDAVSAKRLAANATYTLKGSLNVVAADGSCEPLTGADGAPVTAERTFTATGSEQDIEIEFGFDATGLAGKQVVVFEELWQGGAKLAEHADAADAGQTVHAVAPEISTVATDAADGDKEVVAGHAAAVTDTVRYSGLIPGETYTVTGTLNIVADDGTASPLRDAQGNIVSATREFTPSASAGEVEVRFSFDAAGLAGADIVAYEVLFKASSEICRHEDPEDPSQTVSVAAMALASAASDAADGDKAVAPDAAAKVRDTVHYTGAPIGEELTFSAIMADPATGLPLLAYSADDPQPDTPDAGRASKRLAAFFARYSAICGMDGAQMPSPFDAGALELLLAEYPDVAGRLVTATAKAVPASSDGSVELAYGFDARGAAGGAGVSLVRAQNAAGEVVAVHADLSDAGQTVRFDSPAIKTRAYDATDGDNEVFNSDEAHIIDTVTYRDLTPGREYTVKGTLMDKETGKPVLAADKPVEGKAVFTPAAPSGEAEVDFVFDARGLAGKSLVAFEYLYTDMDVEGASEPVLVAKHADIGDADQTVAVVGAAPGEGYPKTGAAADGAGGLALAIALGAVALTALCCSLYGRRRAEG